MKEDEDQPDFTDEKQFLRKLKGEKKNKCSVTMCCAHARVSASIKTRRNAHSRKKNAPCFRKGEFFSWKPDF